MEYDVIKKTDDKKKTQRREAVFVHQGITQNVIY
jgi:hypothetical protein